MLYFCSPFETKAKNGSSFLQTDFTRIREATSSKIISESSLKILGKEN